MEIIQDLIITNQKVIKTTMKNLKNNPELLVIGVPYIILLALGMMMATSISLIGGLLLFLIESAVFSSYLYVVDRIVTTGKFHMDDVKDGFTVYFRKIYIILLIFYFVNVGLSLFVYPLLSIIPFSYVIILLIQLAIFLIFNPLPEMIYQRYYSEVETIKHTFEFSKNNIITWFVPNILFMIVIGGLTYIISSALLMIIPTNLGSSLNISLQIVLSLIIVQGVIGAVMVYRGNLFNALINSSRRKRMFKRHMDN